VKTSPNKDILEIDLTLEKLEAMLHTSYFQFQHEATGHTVARTASYFLPEEVHAHIDLIGKLDLRI
jgi:hypothetical protein